LAILEPVLIKSK